MKMFFYYISIITYKKQCKIFLMIDFIWSSAVVLKPPVVKDNFLFYFNFQSTADWLLLQNTETLNWDVYGNVKSLQKGEKPMPKFLWSRTKKWLQVHYNLNRHECYKKAYQILGFIDWTTMLKTKEGRALLNLTPVLEYHIQFWI